MDVPRSGICRDPFRAQAYEVGMGETGGSERILDLGLEVY